MRVQLIPIHTNASRLSAIKEHRFYSRSWKMSLLGTAKETYYAIYYSHIKRDYISCRSIERL